MHKNKVSIAIKRNGSFIGEFTGWKDITLTNDIDNLAKTLQVSIIEDAKKNRPFQPSNDLLQALTIKKRDEYIVKIDGVQWGNGFIKSRQEKSNSRHHSIIITGTDKTIDIAHSSLIGNANLTAPFTTTGLVNHILSHLGITGISVINKTGRVDTYDKDFEVDNGNNAWKILSRQLQKKSVFAITNAEGNIVLFQGSFDTNSTQLISNRTNNKNNNVLEVDIIEDDEAVYNKIAIVSQSGGGLDAESSAEQGGEDFSAFDNNIRKTRQLEIASKVSMTSDECQAKAKFETNFRKTKGDTKNFIVQGFFRAGTDFLWLPNFLTYIEVDYLNIKDYFLIKKVVFTQNIDTGSITTLEMVDKNSYKITEPVVESSAGGFNF